MDTPNTPRWMWPLFAVTSVAFLAAMAADSETLKLVFKSLPVLTLAVGAIATTPRTRFRVLVAIGLLLGALGDFLLEVDSFVPGLIAFLVGHILYIAAFVGLSRSLRPLTGLLYLAVGVTLTLSVLPGAEDLAGPVAVYALVISAMGWRAAALRHVVPDRVAIPIAVGGALFIVSDALIAIDRFRTDVPAASWLIMLTYLAAQGLIAFGAVRSTR